MPVFFLAMWIWSWTAALQGAGVREVVTLSDAAVAFAGIVLVYLARKVMHGNEEVAKLHESINGDRGISRSINRIESQMEKVNNMVQAQRVTIDNLADDVRHNSRRLENCPYHGPERRQIPRGHEERHDE